MKRGLKGCLVAAGSLVVFVAVVVCLVCWLVFTPARLTGIVNKVADKYLDCDISVEEVELTLFSTFPNMQLHLSNVLLVNPIGGAENDTVASIGYCQAVLDIDAFVNESVVVLHNLKVDGVSAHLYVDTAGVANYKVAPFDVWFGGNQSSESKISTIDVKDVDVRDIRVSYCNEAAEQSFAIDGLNLYMGGCMQGERLQAELNASLNRVTALLGGEGVIDACLEDVTLGVSGEVLGADTQAGVKLMAGSIDAMLPEVRTQVEHLQWNFEGNGNLGEWVGQSELTTQSVVATVLGKNPMNSSLSTMHLKTGVQWLGEEVMLSPAIMLSKLNLSQGGKRMARNTDMQFRANLCADTLLECVSLSKGVLALNECEMSFEGNVEMPDTSTINADVNFRTNRCDIAQLLALVPQDYHYLLDGIDVNGGISLKGKGQGSLVGGEARIGGVDATLSLDNIDFLYDDDIALQSRRASVNMSYDGKKDEMAGHLSSKALHVTMEGMADVALDDMFGDFSIRQATRMAEGRVDAKASFSAESLVATQDTLGFCAQRAMIDVALDADKDKNPQVETMLCVDSMRMTMGEQLAVETSTFGIKGQAAYDEKGSNMLSQWNPHLAVEVVACDVASSVIAHPVSVSHAQFNYADGHFAINDSHILLGNSDFGLRGDVHNIDSFINKSGLLKAELDFESSYTDVSQLMGLVSGLGENSVEKKDSSKVTVVEDEPFMVPLGMDLKLNTDIRTIDVNGLKFDDLGGHLLVKDGVLVLEEMGFTSDAARMQLTAMYKSPRKNHLFVGFDFHLLDIEIDELIHMIPDVDSIVPMLKAFDGEAEFHFAGETYLKSNYDIKMSTLRAAAAIEGKDLVVMDNETFEQISKYLLFEKKTKNVVDSISVELTVFKDEVDLYPFLISMDDYKAVIGGRHNINEDFDFNYHISLTSPVRLGLDIGGTLDDMKFKLVGCKYAQMYNPQKQNAVQARTLQLKKIISNSLKDNVKPQPAKKE